MSKFPFMQYIPKEWLSDPQVSQCKPSTRGIWWDAISAMHEMDRCGQLRGTPENLARVCRCRVDEMRAAIDDLRSTGAADVREKNGVVTLVNRRMCRDAEIRHLVKNRVDRYREKNRPPPLKRGGNAPETGMKRCINHNHNQNQNQKPPVSPPRGTVPSVEAFKLSGVLRDAIRARDPGAKAGTNGDVASWARDIDLLLRIDKRSAEEVRGVIAWCQQPGGFWGPNILSGRKLRQKFDTLLGQMAREPADRQLDDPDSIPRTGQSPGAVVFPPLQWDKEHWRLFEEAEGKSAADDLRLECERRKVEAVR